MIYSTTAGYLATRIAGAPPMRRPATPVAQLPFNELRELQQLLVRAGYNVGKVDGVMGQQSRSAVKAMQIKYGLPADLAYGGAPGADAGRSRATGSRSIAASAIAPIYPEPKSRQPKRASHVFLRLDRPRLPAGSR